MSSFMLKAGVVGWPVSHSLSPKLHNYWLKKYDIAGEYHAYPVEPENLKTFIDRIIIDGLQGVNLTIPHKETVMEYLDDIDELARSIGAVNTIISHEGKLTGTNTDAYGFAQNIKPHITGTKKAVVLGAGGAAKAIVSALKSSGFQEIIITNRTPERAEKIANDMHISVEEWEHRSDILAGADLLVNTTSLGLANNPPLDIDLTTLPEHALVTDAVYTPLVTPFLAQARARKNQTVDGLGMLIYQAVPAFEAWFGVKPEVELEALKAYLLQP